MPNPTKKPPNEQFRTGDQQRLSGVQHLFAADKGQTDGVNAAIAKHVKDVAAEPFKTRRPYWSK